MENKRLACHRASKVDNGKAAWLMDIFSICEASDFLPFGFLDSSAETVEPTCTVPRQPPLHQTVAKKRNLPARQPEEQIRKAHWHPQSIKIPKPSQTRWKLFNLLGLAFTFFRPVSDMSLSIASELQPVSQLPQLPNLFSEYVKWL